MRSRQSFNKGMVPEDRLRYKADDSDDNCLEDNDGGSGLIMAMVLTMMSMIDSFLYFLYEMQMKSNLRHFEKTITVLSLLHLIFGMKSDLYCML